LYEWGLPVGLGIKSIVFDTAEACASVSSLLSLPSLPSLPSSLSSAKS